MGHFVLVRLLWAMGILFGITAVAYFLVTLVPGDAVDLFVDPSLSTVDRARQRAALGLDRPVLLQYLHWLGQLLQGNLGYSFTNGRPVLGHLLERMPPTLLLAGAAFVSAYGLSILLGVTAASRPYSWLDYLSSLSGLVGLSLPSFFLGLLAIYSFSLRLHWFPMGGMQTVGGASDWKDVLHHLVLPASVLGLYILGPVVRHLRSALLEVLNADFIRTARAKGVRSRSILYKHALRNALIPGITMAGLQIPYLLSGTIIVEQVFNWPGIGRLTLNAIYQRDYPLIMGVTLFSAVLVLLAGLLTDIAYAWANPRVRYQ